jgi:hypothetical protein
MVKVTAGGRRIGAVAAHLSYISQHGELEIETDEGQRVPKEDQKELLKDWHLELSAGQYRQPLGQKTGARGIKLVHNIVLSMPAPTPSEKVLAAAKVFAREKFGVKHRYAMALHTHQPHPHVHLVVKAEREDGRGRLHIDKAMLREWRQDFARMMRDQGIAANATPRVIRGPTKRTVRDPGHAKLEETRKAIVAGWLRMADTLEAQGEIVLGGDVRYYAMHLPPVLTDRERLAAEFVRFSMQRSARTRKDDAVRDHTMERTR